MKTISKVALLKASSAFVLLLFCVASGSALAQEQGSVTPSSAPAGEQAQGQGQGGLLAQAQGSATPSAPAGEQAVQQGGLEEITVTARKVEENLMEVPTAVSALSNTDIQSAGITDLSTLVKFTPGLIDTGAAGTGKIGTNVNRSYNQLTFRGLSVDTGLNFIDGAPYSGSELPDLTEVARVEVLKGPQSVYFGRSTFSGAVNYVTKDPGDTLEGSVTGDLRSYGTTDLHASLSGPITDTLGFVITGRDYSTDGQYANPLEGNRLGAESTDALTGKLVLKPNAQIAISGYYSVQLNDDGEPAEGVMLARSFVPTANPNVITSPLTGGALNCKTGGTGGPWFCGQLPTLTELQVNDPLIISSYNRMDPLTDQILIQDIPLPVGSLNNAKVSYPYAFNPNWLDHYGQKQLAQTAHLRFDDDMVSGWTLNAIAAFDNIKTETLSDFNYYDASQLPNPSYVSPTATPYLPVDNLHAALGTSITTDFSGEVRVSTPVKEPIRGTLGASYLQIENPNVAQNGFGTTGLVQNNSTYGVSRTPAIFGGVYYDFLPGFTLSGEARYQWDYIVQRNIFPIPTADLQKTYNSFSPRVTLDYKYTADSLAYVLFSRGYKPGGFNTALISSVPSVVAQLATAGAQLGYAQEKINNYEVGIKSTWLNNRLQTVIDYYYDQWLNGQLSESIFVTQPNGGSSASGVTLNTGKVTLTGIEAEAHYAPTNQWLISATMAYMHNVMNNYQDFSFGAKVYGSTNADGYTLPGAPEWTFSLSPQYTAHLGDVGDWVTRIDATYRSRMFLDTHDLAWTAPLILVNLRTGITRNKLTVEAYSNNLFNNMTIPNAGISMDVINQNINANALRVIPPVKRVFGVDAHYAF